MKIWILQAYDQPKGQSTRSGFFAEAFAQSGHDVHLFTNAYCHYFKKNRIKVTGNHMHDLQDGYHVIWLKSWAYKSNAGRVFNMIENMWRILIASRDIKDVPDVIIAPSVPPFTALAGYLLSRKWGIKFIYEIRDVWPSALIESGTLSKWNPLSIMFARLEKLFIRKSHMIVSVLDNVIGYVVSKGAEKSKIQIIPNGLPQSIFETNLTSKILLKNGKTNITYVGQYGNVHDVLVFAKAAKARQNDQALHFNFFGDGVKKQETIDYVQRHKLDNVTLHEVIPSDAIMEVLEQSDILIAGIVGAAHFQYGLNLNKIMYYVASGKPIIFAGNEKPKILQRYKLGYYADAGDWQEIVKLIDEICLMNSEELKALSKRAKSAFDKEINIKGLANKYNNALIDLFEG